MKRLLIPDASVILKRVLKTREDHVEAMALLPSWIAGELEIVLPSLWIYEVGNIVGRKHAEKSEEIMEILLAYRFPEARIDSDHVSTILDLMRRYGVTFYDASYHTIALKSGGIFVTADEVYVHQAGDAGQVTCLRDLEI